LADDLQLVSIVITVIMEIGDWLIINWKPLLFCIGLFLIGFGMIRMAVRKINREELNKEDQKIKELKEAFADVAKSNGLNNRIIHDLIIPKIDKSELVDTLLKEPYSIDQLTNWGFDFETRQAFLAKAHLLEAEKIKELKLPDINDNDKVTQME